MAESPEEYTTKLIHVAKKGLTGEVLRLLRKNELECAAVCDKHGRNCLHLAAIYGHFDTTLAILQTSLIDINSTNSKGLTPLHDACLECHSDIVLLLLSFGAHIMARSKDGWTCAMCACSSGHGQLAQMLFAAGCDVNALSRHDLSALHIAAWKGHVHVVEILIAEGSALDQKSKNGKTALDLARDEGHQECCAVLEAAMGMNTTDMSVRLKAVEGQLKVVQEKLQFSQESFSELLKKEKKQWENEVALMKEQHVKEINNLKEEITVLTDKLTSKMALGIPFPQVELSGPESPRPIRKHKKSSHHPRRRPTELPSTLTTHLITPVDSRLSKSADNLAQWGSMDNVDSDDGATKMNTKLSITELVEESLRKPESMASIRKELKEAKLTPKMQRKFGPCTGPPPLKEVQVVVSPSDEIKTSPLTQAHSQADQSNKQ